MCSVVVCPVVTSVAVLVAEYAIPMGVIQAVVVTVAMARSNIVDNFILELEQLL
jgi:hypothetical protein